MLPVNKGDVCQRILETGRYQFPLSKIREDVWLIAWLKSKGFSYQETYDKWKPIYLTRHPDTEVAQAIFDKLWMNSRRMRFTNRYKPIIFYKEEIEEIARCDAARWQKEAILLVYAVMKALDAQSVDVLPFREIIALTSHHNNLHDYEIGELIAKCKQLGLIQFQHNRKWDSVMGEYEDFVRYSCPKIKENGTEAKKVRCVLDVPDSMFGFIKTRICVECGKEFEVNNKSKSDRCDKCYVKYRKKYKRKWINNFRKKDEECSGG